jgi:hypothetical protein
MILTSKLPDMMKKIFWITLLLFSGVLIHAHNEQGLKQMPKTLNFQLKAMENGEIMLKLDTRKKEFTIRPQKEENDTTIQFQWGNKEKEALSQYLNQNNVLERLGKISGSRPSNLKQSGKLIYFFIEKGNKKDEYWIRPEKIKDSPDREFISEFIRNIVTIFQKNMKRRQVPSHQRE